MAARPYFTGDYGAHLARVDTRPIIEAGKAQGQIYAQMGGQLGSVIQQYGLNKQKREEMTNEIEGAIRMNPGIVTRLTGTGDEAFDKKQQTAIDKLTSGDANMTVLRGLAGDIARLEKQDLKEQAEATARSQAISDQLNQELLRQNVAGKKQSNLEAQRLSKLEQEKRDQEDQMYEWGNERIHFLLGEAASDPDFDPAKLDVRDQKLFANYQLWSTKNYPLSEFIGKPGDKVELDALRQGFKQALQNYEKGEFELISAEQKVELTGKELAEADRIPQFEDNAAVLEYKASLPEGATAKFSKKGTGFDLENITLTAKAEEQMTPVDGMPGHFLYGGGLYKAEEVGGKKTFTKITAQSFGQDVEMLERGIKVLQTPELTAYEKGKSLAYERDDDGNYIYADSQGDDVEVPFSHEYERQLFELNKMKAKYKKALGDNLIDLRSR